MKAHSWLAICLGAALAAVPATAASSTPSAPAASDSVFVDVDAADVREVRLLGEKAITRVGMSLVSEVSASVSKDGPDKAVEVCHLKALPLTGEIIAGMPRITAVKRTSLKLRNPANAPDEYEQRALERFRRKLEDGAPPSVLVQRIDHPDTKPEWRVYRPVVVLQQCVTCHGPVENQSPALRATLQQRYPQDQAVGYKLHDWRGLVRVTVGDPPAAKPAAAASKVPAAKPAKKK